MLMNLIQIELLLHYGTSIALGISLYAIICSSTLSDVSLLPLHGRDYVNATKLLGSIYLNFKAHAITPTHFINKTCNRL